MASEEIDLNKIKIYEWAELNSVEIKIEIGIKALKVLHNNLESSTQKQTDKFIQTVIHNKGYDELEGVEKEQYYSHFYEYDEIILNFLKRQQRYSTVLSLFAFFESELKSICEIIEYDFFFEKKLKNSNGKNDLLKLTNYIKTNMGFESKSNVSFININQQKNTRNSIAHSNGIVLEYKQNDIKITEGLSLKKTATEFQIELDSIYILNLIKNMESFFNELLNAIDLRAKTLNKTL